MKGLSRDSLWDAGLFHFAATLVWVFWDFRNKWPLRFVEGRCKLSLKRDGECFHSLLLKEPHLSG